jgi:hypothetical protein
MLEDTFEDDFDAYKRIFKPELNWLKSI